MAKFVYLLQESPTLFQGMSPGEIQAILQKYFDWRERLERENRFVSGYKLASGGRTLRREGSKLTVQDGPFGESKEIVGGLLIVEARDYAHAIELARDSPHFDNGWIEIREIEAGA